VICINTPSTLSRRNNPKQPSAFSRAWKSTISSLAVSAYVCCRSRDSTTTVVTGNGFSEARKHILGSAWTVGSSTGYSGQETALRWTTRGTITRRSVPIALNSSMLRVEGASARRSMCADGFRRRSLSDAPQSIMGAICPAVCQVWRP
jgi:hypothetical protein